MVFSPLPVMARTMDSSGFRRPWRDQLARHGDGHAARGFGEDAFRFPEQADALHNFLIAHILARAAAAEDVLTA